MTTKCVDTLSYRLPAQPLNGANPYDATSQEMTPTQIHQTYPFVEYASCFWSDHLAGTMNNDCTVNEKFPTMIEAMGTFLSSKRKLLAYIEVMYIFRATLPLERLNHWAEMVTSSKMCGKVENGLLHKVTEDISELSRFVGALDREWGDQLRLSPRSIWTETTAFTRSRLINENRDTQVHSLIREPPKNESISSRYLSKISEMSEDGKTVAILSIWPSKYVTIFCYRTG
jgi:hypothetical protein